MNPETEVTDLLLEIERLEAAIERQGENGTDAFDTGD